MPLGDEYQTIILSAVATKSQRAKARFKITDAKGNVHFPINDCSDVSDAWGLRGNSSIPKDRVERYIKRVAGQLGCKGPWNEDDDGGKAATDMETKDGRVPTLTGDEAPHNKPIAAILDQLETLIGQELAEDEPEFDCIVRLSCIAQDLISWARSETVEDTDYGSLPMAMTDYLRAGIQKLAVPAPPVEPEPAEEPSEVPEEFPDWMRMAIENYQAAPESPQHSVDESSDDREQLPHAVRHRHGRYASWSQSFTD